MEDFVTSKARPGVLTHHVVVRLDESENKYPIADLVSQSFVFVLASHADGWAEIAATLTAESAK